MIQGGCTQIICDSFRMQNPGLQIEIPQVNEDALLQEPMNNNGMSVNSQATIENRRGNNSNSENGASVYDEGDDVEMEGGKRLRRRKTSRKGKKSMRKNKKTRKGKKQARKTKKARKAKKSHRGSRK